MCQGRIDGDRQNHRVFGDHDRRAFRVMWNLQGVGDFPRGAYRLAACASMTRSLKSAISSGLGTTKDTQVQGVLDAPGAPDAARSG